MTVETRSGVAPEPAAAPTPAPAPAPTPAPEPAPTPDAPAAPDPSRGALRRVLGDRDVRLLAAGAGTSLLGDQFSLLATPWLVLQLTDSPAALGTALALQGAPRAVLMLVGGTICDRFSPRRVLLVADAVRAVLTGALAAAVLTGTAHLWTVYLVSVLLGVASGFSVPAENSMVPRLVRPADLQAGNAVLMALTQLAGFVGPAVAGTIIGRRTAGDAGLGGVGLAFAVDAATFLVSVAALLAMRGARQADGRTAERGVLAATLDGFRLLWRDPVLRALLGVLLAINLLLTGPLMVGIPQLAHERLPGGASAFGLLMSVHALGNLLGFAAAGSLPAPSGRRIRFLTIALVSGFGVGLAALGLVTTTWAGAAVLGVLGVGNGFMAVTLVTGMQARTPADMVGRMMSLVMLAGSGLVPVSQALAGLLGARSLTALFVGPGVAVLALGVGLAFVPAIGRLGDELAAGRAAGTRAAGPIAEGTAPAHDGP